MLKTYFFIVFCAISSGAIAKNGITQDYEFELVYDAHAFDVDGNRQSAGEFSRARLSVETESDSWIKAKMSLDFDESGDDPEVKDAYISFEPVKGVDISAGKMKLPGGLDQSLSTTKQFFLDRSLANNLFGLGRSSSIEVAADKGHFNVVLSAFFEEDKKSTPLRGLATKAFYLFNNNSYNANHGEINGGYSEAILGLYVSRIQPKNDQLVYGPSTTIFAADVDGYKLKQSNDDLESYSTISYNFGYRYDSWLLQGEYFSRLQETAVNESYSLAQYYSTGYYGLLSKSFGGTKRILDKDAFEPDYGGNIGLEVSLRYSSVDMRGYKFIGKAEIASIAANMYFSKNSKICIQYEYGDVLEKDNNKHKEQESTGVLSFRIQYTY